MYTTYKQYAATWCFDFENKNDLGMCCTKPVQQWAFEIQIKCPSPTKGLTKHRIYNSLYSDPIT